MKRYTIVKHIISLLHENDILIFSGKELCKEAYAYHNDNHFYIEDSMGVAAPFGLGIAMCTDKRVFVFLGEGELLRELGVLSQIGASKCRNMFLILLDNGCYQSVGGFPSVFDSLLSKKGFIYNANVKVVTFTKHFKDKDIKRLRNRFPRLVGPLVILMDVDKGIKKNLSDVDLDVDEQRENIIKLVTDLEKETAMFVPPIALGTDTEIKTLNVDTLKTGGTD
jgi:thiamine pyrophosphate-dependent acetolactate synthase large subunit-like protein